MNYPGLVPGVPGLFEGLSSDPAVAWKLPADARRHLQSERTATASPAIRAASESGYTGVVLHAELATLGTG